MNPSRMRALFRILICGCLWVAAAGGLTAAEPRAFTAKSLEEIKKAHVGRSFILAFWSVTCEPCREELTVLTDLHRKFPDVPVILVAADPPSQRAAVMRFLERYPLGRIQRWQFADDFTEPLRYSVDRSWRGELPRAFFFDPKHEVTSHTGVVDPKWLQGWMERASRAPAR
jgi:thiol-disulfide isomerase/thioredoxin